MGCLLSVEDRAAGPTITHNLKLFGGYGANHAERGATCWQRAGKCLANLRKAPSLDGSYSPVDALLQRAEPGEMAVLDERQLRAALQHAPQPVLVLTVPVLTPAGMGTDPASSPLESLLTNGVSGALERRLENSDGGQATFRLSFGCEAASLVISTEQGATSLRCVLANKAALRALELEDEQAVLGFLARSFRADKGLVSLFHDSVKRLLAGQLATAKHFVPGDFGRDRYFLSLRISPFAFRTDRNPATTTTASGQAPECATTTPGSNAPPTAPAGAGSCNGGDSGSGGGSGGGGTIFPGMLLELDAPYEGKELAARLQRDYMILSNIPSMVTIFDMNGHVLHQNRSSVGYMGYLVGHGLSMRQQPNHQSSQNYDNDHENHNRQPPHVAAASEGSSGRGKASAFFLMLGGRRHCGSSSTSRRTSNPILRSKKGDDAGKNRAVAKTHWPEQQQPQLQPQLQPQTMPKEPAGNPSLLLGLACHRDGCVGGGGGGDGSRSLALDPAALSALQRLFFLDPAKLADVMTALAEGQEWRGLVRMPRTLIPNHDDDDEDDVDEDEVDEAEEGEGQEIGNDTAAAPGDPMQDPGDQEQPYPDPSFKMTPSPHPSFPGHLTTSPPRQPMMPPPLLSHVMDPPPFLLSPLPFPSSRNTVAGPPPAAAATAAATAASKSALSPSARNTQQRQQQQQQQRQLSGTGMGIGQLVGGGAAGNRQQQLLLQQHRNSRAKSTSSVLQQLRASVRQQQQQQQQSLYPLTAQPRRRLPARASSAVVLGPYSLATAAAAASAGTLASAREPRLSESCLPEPGLGFGRGPLARIAERAERGAAAAAIVVKCTTGGDEPHVTDTSVRCAAGRQEEKSPDGGDGNGLVELCRHSRDGSVEHGAILLRDVEPKEEEEEERFVEKRRRAMDILMDLVPSRPQDGGQNLFQLFTDTSDSTTPAPTAAAMSTLTQRGHGPGLSEPSDFVESIPSASAIRATNGTSNSSKHGRRRLPVPVLPSLPIAAVPRSTRPTRPISLPDDLSQTKPPAPVVMIDALGSGAPGVAQCCAHVSVATEEEAAAEGENVGGGSGGAGDGSRSGSRGGGAVAGWVMDPSERSLHSPLEKLSSSRRLPLLQQQTHHQQGQEQGQCQGQEAHLQLQSPQQRQRFNQLQLQQEQQEGEEEEQQQQVLPHMTGQQRLVQSGQPPGRLAASIEAHSGRLLKRSSTGMSAVMEAWYEEFPAAPQLEPPVRQVSKPLSNCSSCHGPPQMPQSPTRPQRANNLGLGPGSTRRGCVQVLPPRDADGSNSNGNGISSSGGNFNYGDDDGGGGGGGSSNAEDVSDDDSSGAGSDSDTVIDSLVAAAVGKLGSSAVRGLERTSPPGASGGGGGGPHSTGGTGDTTPLGLPAAVPISAVATTVAGSETSWRRRRRRQPASLNAPLSSPPLSPAPPLPPPEPEYEELHVMQQKDLRKHQYQQKLHRHRSAEQMGRGGARRDRGSGGGSSGRRGVSSGGGGESTPTHPTQQSASYLRAPVVPVGSGSAIPIVSMLEAAPTPSPSLVDGPAVPTATAATTSGSAAASILATKPALALASTTTPIPTFASMPCPSLTAHASVVQPGSTAANGWTAAGGSLVCQVMLDGGSGVGADLLLLATGSAETQAAGPATMMTTAMFVTTGTVNCYAFPSSALSSLPPPNSSGLEQGHAHASMIMMMPNHWISMGSTAGITPAVLSVNAYGNGNGNGVCNGPNGNGEGDAARGGIQVATGGPTGHHHATHPAATCAAAAVPVRQRTPCSRFRATQRNEAMPPVGMAGGRAAATNAAAAAAMKDGLASASGRPGPSALEAADPYRDAGCNSIALFLGRTNTSVLSDEQELQLGSWSLPPPLPAAVTVAAAVATASAASAQKGDPMAMTAAAATCHTAPRPTRPSIFSRVNSESVECPRHGQLDMGIRGPRLLSQTVSTRDLHVTVEPSQAGSSVPLAAAAPITPVAAVACGTLPPALAAASSGLKSNSCCRSGQSSCHQEIIAVATAAGQQAAVASTATSPSERSGASLSHTHRRSSRATTQRHEYQDPRSRMRAMLRSVLAVESGGGGIGGSSGGISGCSGGLGGGVGRQSLCSSSYSNRSGRGPAIQLTSSMLPGEDLPFGLDATAAPQLGGRLACVGELPYIGTEPLPSQGCGARTPRRSSVGKVHVDWSWSAAASAAGAAAALWHRTASVTGRGGGGAADADAAATADGAADCALHGGFPPASCSRDSPAAEAAAAIRWHEVHVKPVDDPSSGERVILVIQTDVSNQVRAEEVLTRVLEAEQRLLADIFPRHVVRHMTAARNATAERQRNGLQLLRHIQDPAAVATSHECITVLFADIKGFTEMCREVPPATVMTFLNDLYTRLDSLTDVYGVYKVETIGDCYMVAGGLMARDEGGYGQTVRTREHVDPLHAIRVVAFARAMLAEAGRVRLPNTGRRVQMRIGIHSGPATSGVVGQKMPRFCLFGDTVNTASRMESTGRPGCIHVSASTRALLREEIGWVPTGGVEVKGKGRMETYTWVPQSEGASRHRRDMKQRAMLLGTLPSLYDAVEACAAEDGEVEAAGSAVRRLGPASIRTAGNCASTAFSTTAAVAATVNAVAHASNGSSGGGGDLLSAISEAASHAGNLSSVSQGGRGAGHNGVAAEATASTAVMAAAITASPLAPCLMSLPTDVFADPHRQQRRCVDPWDSALARHGAVRT